MKSYDQVHQKIRHRFLEIRGPYLKALELLFNFKQTKNAVIAFDELLEDGPVCIIKDEFGVLDVVDLPPNIDLSKIPQTTITRL